MTKLTHLQIENMTCFEKISFDFSNGINVFIGENGTGNTHVLKVIKSVLQYNSLDRSLLGFILAHYFNNLNYFRDENKEIGINFFRDGQSINTSILNNLNSRGVGSIGRSAKNTFIPPKDITENSKGFVELNERRELNYSTIYSDILKAAFIPPLRHLEDEALAKVRDKIGILLGGNPSINNNEFYIEQNGKAIPFTLYSEGLRKFALLKILIENGEIAKDTALIWDEPEANLNPKMLKFMAELLLDLEQAGVQIFLSTHEEALINWLEVKRNATHALTYFTLYKIDGAVFQENAAHYNELKHNPIEEAAIEIFDAHMQDENGVLAGAK